MNSQPRVRARFCAHGSPPRLDTGALSSWDSISTSHTPFLASPGSARRCQGKFAESGKIRKSVWKIEEQEASGRYVHMRGTAMRVSISHSQSREERLDTEDLR